MQTPLRGAAADRLAVGDRVWFRHAKAGELCEHVERVARRRRRPGGGHRRRPTGARARPSCDPVSGGRAERVLTAPAAARRRTAGGRRRPGGVGQDDVRRRARAALGRRTRRAHGRPVRGAGPARLVPDVWRRLEAQVLAPLRAGRAGALPDATTGTRSEFAEWLDVPRQAAAGAGGRRLGGPPGRPVGRSCGCGWRCRPTCGWREASARDGEAMRDAVAALAARREDAHFASDGTRERADVVVDGTA